MDHASNRLFFALRPGSAERVALADWASQLPTRGGRRVPADNIHLTLAFLGARRDPEQVCFEQAALSVRGPPFTLVVDRIGYFARARVLWAGPSRSPPELPDLVQGLNRALEPCGYVPDPRPFQPHVTLARKTGPPPAALTPPVCGWRVDRFCLMVSESAGGGVRYRIVRDYPLI